MAKTILSLAAAALLAALALPGAASATDNKRADGLTNQTAQQATEVSAQRRRRVVRRHYRPRHYGYRSYYRYPRYYGNNYAYAPYPYYSRPYYGPRFYGPGFSFGFGW